MSLSKKSKGNTVKGNAAKGNTVSAENRTIGLFSGRTQEEIDKGMLELAEKDAKDASQRPPEPIEVSANRWRDTAFYYQEILSKHYKDETVPPGTARFRLTFKAECPGFMFLEQFRAGADGKGAYMWSGFMFPSDTTTLYELTSCLVSAAKIRKDSMGPAGAKVVMS